MRRRRKLAGVGVTLLLTATMATTARADDDTVPPAEATLPPTSITLTTPVDDTAPPTTGETKETQPPASTDSPTSVSAPTSTEASQTATTSPSSDSPPSSEEHPSITDEPASTSTPAITTTPTTVVSICDTDGCHDYSVPDDSTPVTIERPGFPGGVTTTSDGKDSALSPDETSSTTTTTTVSTNHQDQQTVASGTLVAGANSGLNVTYVDQPNTVTSQPPGAGISTGDVAAVGSQDVNTVVQGADVTLTGNAVANLIQLALILNFGAAAANSGDNAVLSADGTSVGGSIGTGGSSAIGNSIASYITQAANANAGSALNDSTAQQALSLFLGYAIANSGINSIAGNGAVGTGGSVDAGSAQAVGNDSVTSITQWAKLMGADDSVINVLQRATVLNLGFALANSGLNDISGVAGSLLSATDEQDDQLAEQLFAMLLPALLSQYGYGGNAGGGAGQVGTGPAQAIGNQSSTDVLQTVGATASGTGIVDMVQDVLVANEGGALANTGINTIGGVKTLDPQTATAVVQMAAFLSAILSKIHHSSAAGNALAAESQGIDIPFGDFILHLDASLSGLDTTFTAGVAKANVHQITVVISFGMASANSGKNVAATISDTNVVTVLNAVMPTLLADNGLAPSAIGTGPTDAENHTLVQICQKINADSITCLAPPPPPPPPADDTPPDQSTTTTVPDQPTTTQPRVDPVIQPPSGPLRTLPVFEDAVRSIGNPDNFVEKPTGTITQGTLPSTGVDINTLMADGFWLIVVGGALIFVRRRRRTV